MTQTKAQERKERSDKGRVQLTDRDQWALRWVAQQYAVRLDQVQNLLGREAGRGAKEEGMISENAARLVVNRWKRAKLAEYRKITVEDPGWVWMTAHGLQEFALPYKMYEPSLAKLDHLFHVNEVRLMLEDERLGGTWRSERAMRAGMTYTKGDTFPHLPDAVLTTAEGPIAIEVELTPKKPADLLAIVQELAQTYDQVWYFTTDETHNGLLAAKRRLEQEVAERVVVRRSPGCDGDGMG